VPVLDETRRRIVIEARQPQDIRRLCWRCCDRRSDFTSRDSCTAGAARRRRRPEKSIRRDRIYDELSDQPVTGGGTDANRP
jgi:hypothetical protein